jgi:large subunit ribosomal protein L24
MKIRKGDTVLVIAGKDKGKEGTVDRVLPKQNKVVVTGINTAVRHQRPLRANEPGGRIDKDMPIDISNVMLVHNGKPVRVGYRVESDGSKVRIARPSGEVIK